jgi:hypothetical protein
MMRTLSSLHVAVTFILTSQAATMQGLCVMLCLSSWPFHVNAYSSNGNPRFGKLSKEQNEGGVRKLGDNANHANIYGAITRRTAIFNTFCSSSTLIILPKNANAACLMGDTSPDCIGVYKMPMDDRALGYVDTPEKLATFAPDVRYVPPVPYPKSYTEAKSELDSLQKRCAALDGLVLRGNLTEVGVEILAIIPRLTVDGRVMIQDLNDAKVISGVDMSMKAYRAESAHVELLNKLGQCDILIGQALAGQLGAPAPAQIQILSDVKEANELFNEFMKSIPDDFKPGKKKGR